MTPDRYQRLSELCHRALDLPPPERRQFVETACGDDASMREELSSLLAASDRSEGVLDRPASDLAAAALRGRSQTLGHYRIRSTLGSGGMGEVVLAEDVRLGRMVALKLLRSESAGDPERQRRLLVEARAASALSHPNVAHVYEVGESGGVSYIAMEYIPGQTLSATLARRRLTADESLAIAVQIADALDEAHAKGIVHRDIKPANILITPRGVVKVLDFGIAKLVAADSANGTAPGLVIGTADYMSPEQALGLPVDFRSDIFSFGTVLYEMISARKPFRGRTERETLDKVAHAEPDGMAEVAAASPPSLVAVVRRCLEKDRERRYASAGQLLAALRELRAPARPRRWPRRAIAIAAGLAAAISAAGAWMLLPAARAPSRVRVAVLPFDDLGTGPARGYLADALTEETISALGQLDPQRITVIGRKSVMAFKSQNRPLPEIARELAADYLVESSIRAEANRVRVTPTLIRASDQAQVWSASYDSEPASMLAFQRELGLTIAEQVRLRLDPDRLEALARRQTRNPEAYDLYLRGRHAWSLSTPASSREAIEFFKRAAALDPSYALAWSGLADAYTSSPITADVPPAKAGPLAREAALAALAADPKLAESQSSLAFVNFWIDWKWADAEAGFRKAVALDASYAFAHRMLGIVLAHVGRHGEAREEMQRARELDPLFAMHHALSAQVAFGARDYAAAIGFARQAVVVDPTFWIGHFQLAQAYFEAGQFDDAFRLNDDAARLSAGNSKAIGLRGYMLARRGRTAEARQVLGTLQAAARERFVPPYAFALVHAGLGDADAAMAALEAAYAVRDVHLVLIGIDPKWDPYRRDPRFVDLLRRCGFTGIAPLR